MDLSVCAIELDINVSVSCAILNDLSILLLLLLFDKLFVFIRDSWPLER